MGLTPLVRSAFRLNRLLQYSQPFSWNSSEGKFSQSQKSFKTLHLWVIANCILLPWIFLNCTVVLVAYWKSFYKFLNFFQLSTIIVQGLIIIPILVTSYFFFFNSHDWAAFLNNLFILFVRLNPEKSNKSCIGYLSRSKYQSNRNFELIDWVIMGGYLTFTFFEIALPPFVIRMRLDSPHHFFKIIFPACWYRSMASNVAIQLTRGFITCWAIFEGVNGIRTYVLYIVTAFETYKEILAYLQKVPVTRGALRKYYHINLIFTVMNDSLSIIMPVYLAGIYIVMIFCNTITVLGLQVLEWHFYVGVPFAGLFGLSQLIFGWYTAILVAEQSRKLKIEWVRKLGYFGPDNKWLKGNRLFLKKTLASIRPIVVTYGSLGTMTKKTRTRYLYSLLYDSVQLILAFRESGRVLWSSRK